MKIAILGGGISGLSAAWYLLKKDPRLEISLFEASSRLGGWIESKNQDGFIFELGPRTFQRGRCPELLSLIQQLGLQPIFSQTGGSKFLWYKEQLRPLRSFWPQIFRALLQDLLAQRGDGKDESIEAFAKRRMGKQAAALFFDPMAKGVFGGDIQKLSLQACFPFLYEAEKKERSIVKWMFKQEKKEPGLFTLANGMETLIDALAKMPIDVHLQTPIEKITLQGVEAKGAFYPADLIISALPGLELSRIINIPLTLRNQHLSVVNTGFRKSVLSNTGYGYLVPSACKENILGQIWDTCVFPVPNQTKLSSMIIGDNPIETALLALKRHLGITEAPSAIAFKKAYIPQYDVGHLSRIQVFEEAILSRYQGKLKIIGNYLYGASVESCLNRSKIIAIN